LRLAPATFWTLSLSEWRALIAPPQRARLARHEFEEMLKHYPDVPRPSSLALRRAQGEGREKKPHPELVEG